MSTENLKPPKDKNGSTNNTPKTKGVEVTTPKNNSVDEAQDKALEELFASENNKPRKVDAVVKINVVLPKHHHKKFKTYCLVEEIKMQEHLQKLIVNYINKLPDYIK